MAPSTKSIIEPTAQPPSIEPSIPAMSIFGIPIVLSTFPDAVILGIAL